MKDYYTTVFSNQHDIAARVCPRGVIALSIGHISVTLQKIGFLRLAQVIRGAESCGGKREAICPGEARH